MLPFKVLRIAEHQRVVWYRDGNFQAVLTPGKCWFWRRLRHSQFQSYDVRDAECALPHARYLVRMHAEALRPHLDWTILGEHDVGLVLVDRIARRLALPGEVVAYWRDNRALEVRTLDIAGEVAVPAEWIKAMNRAADEVDLTTQRKAVYAVNVDEGFESILIIDGEVYRTLQPGRHAFWRIGRDIKALTVDKRPQEIELNGQEILTKDRVSLRINASLHYRVVDSLRAAVETPDATALAYRVVQFALRRALGSLTLDELLADKSRLGDEVQREVSARLAEAGIAVAMLGIKDVILPGEMRTILNQVVEAEKLTEANAIRRRDETHNVRALANTARQLEGNPMMARLKELEALQNVTSRVSTLNVYQGLEGVMSQLVSLKAP
jgi:regulator of protease activity HflC (stomatin/prohibitin superfamily)